ncbi:MAG TPA: VTT domain-containing protein [Vicinamibacterales bacterium]|nr:VTT domain-containing protein [Vicinamibacterales bacterium]
MRRRNLVLFFTAVLLAGALYSYLTSGFVYVLVAGAPDEQPWMERLRQIVAAWGPLAPVAYTLIVVIEVVVAPIPGALLYAPGGAIFGGFIGGTLSLIGNVIGAALCCVLGSLIGERIIGTQAQSPQFARYQERLAARGLWVVLLLRANPLTSSDLVSYAAGVASVPPWKVAIGTLFGLAPLCYLQAYFAEQVFTLVPGRVLIASSVVVAAIVIAVLARGRRESVPR